MNKKKLIRIIIPICIVLVVAGIWMAKNTGKGVEALENQTTPLLEEEFRLEVDAIDLESLLAYGLPMIIDFGADSCDPCKAMAPVLIKLNSEMQGKAIIKFVDVWKNKDAANDFPIQVIPTQVLINADGTPYVPSDTMNIKFDMYTYKETNEHAFTVHQGGLTEKQMRAILTDMGVEE